MILAPKTVFFQFRPIRSSEWPYLELKTQFRGKITIFRRNKQKKNTFFSPELVIQSENSKAHWKAEFIGYLPEPIRIDFELFKYVIYEIKLPPPQLSV